MASEAAEAVPKGLSDEELERAKTNFKDGKALIDDDPEKAVELLFHAVRAYEKHYGGDALECAEVYLNYGIALYEVARASTDALGKTQTTVQAPSEEQEAGPSAEGAAAGSDAAAEPAGDSGKNDAAAAGTDAETGAKAAAEPSSEKAPAPAGAADAEAAAPEPEKAAAGADAGEAAAAAAGAAADAAGADATTAKEGATDAAEGEEGAEGDKDAAGGEEGAEAEGEEGADGEAEGNDGGEGGEGEAEGGEGGDGGDDMQLAWEMIELAHVILKRHPPEQHTRLLAVVHKSLADIAAEQERFEEAVELYKRAVEFLQALSPPNRRWLAEVQYKLSVTLTYCERPDEALAQTEAALGSLAAAVAEIEDKMAALPTDGSGGEDAEEQGRQLQATADDLRGVMAELQHNCEGLRDTIAHNNSLKEALREAFAKASGMSGDPAGAVAATLSNAFAAPSKAAAAGQPVSLGVVGRGTKRITLQPTAGGGGSGAAASAAAPEEKQPPSAAGGKRTLGDMLNGGGPSPASGSEGEKGGGAEAVEVARGGEGKENAKKARTEEAAA